MAIPDTLTAATDAFYASVRRQGQLIRECRGKPGKWIIGGPFDLSVAISAAMLGALEVELERSKTIPEDGK